MAGILSRVSTTTTGQQLPGASQGAAISADGRTIVFNGTDPTTNKGEVFVKDRSTGALTDVSERGGAASGYYATGGTISTDGSTVAFSSSTANGYQIWVTTPGGGTPTAIVPLPTGSARLGGISENPALSADGRILAFDSSSALTPEDDDHFEIYVKNLDTGALTLVSKNNEGVDGNVASTAPFLSADGRTVMFTSTSNSLLSDFQSNVNSRNVNPEVYVKDLQTGQLKIASVNPDGSLISNSAYGVSISSDGTLVAMSVNTSNGPEIYVKNMTTGALTLASSNAAGVVADGMAVGASMSADGHSVLFHSTATNLGPTGDGQSFQTFVKDLQTGAVALLYRDAAHQDTNGQDFTGTRGYAFSASDRVAVFESDAAIAQDDTNGRTDIYAVSPAPPTVGIGTASGLTNQTTPTVTGTVGAENAGTTVSITEAGSGALLGSGTVALDGSFAIAAALTHQGDTVLLASDTNEGGTGTSNSITLTLDSVAPSAASPTLTVAQNAPATPIGIAAPSDNMTAPASLAIAVSALPSDGTVTLADGTAVTAGRSLTVAQLTGLQFTPTPSAASQSSAFLYSVTDEAGNVTTGTATLIVGAAAASPPVQPTPPAVPVTSAVPDAVSLDPQVTFAGRGAFTLTGSVSSAAGVKGVELSAVVDGGTRQDLGAAILNPDGTFNFTDLVGAHIQSFIYATETDGAGLSTTTTAAYALTGNLRQGRTVAEQDSYDASGMSLTSSSLFHRDGSRTVDIVAGGQTLTSDFFDTFDNHGAPGNTFVFNAGHGLDVINLFRVNGIDHNTVSLLGSDFGNSIAEVLRNTTNTTGGAVILDPTSGDAVRLAGITKAQLVHNQEDFTFHA